MNVKPFEFLSRLHILWSRDRKTARPYGSGKHRGGSQPPKNHHLHLQRKRKAQRQARMAAYRQARGLKHRRV